MEEKDFEWISASEYAKREGVTTQTVYNWIKEQKLVTMEFTRGKMNGVLIQVPKKQE